MQIKKHKVSILGCGWLGLALAKKLQAEYDLICSVSSKESLSKTKPFKTIIQNSNNYNNKEFFDTNTLLIAFPPKNNYLNNLLEVAKNIKKDTQTILISSTSIYKSLDKEYITEKDSNLIKEPNIMLQAELLIKKLIPNVVILRAGGLMGYNRIAGKYSAGKKLENKYVNYIHQEDLIDVIKLIISKKINTKTYNVVAPLNKTRKEVFSYTSKKYNFTKTTFTNIKPTKNIILSTKLQKELNFKFQYNTIETMFNNTNLNSHISLKP
jgi:nucleoside-diphosphate-sugar epimerase